MNLKTAITAAAIVLLPLTYYSVSQESRAPLPSPDAAGRASEIQTPEGLQPYGSDPVTGELRNHKGEVVADPEQNTPQRKYERLLATWAIQNPAEYWKTAKPVYPPKLDPDEPEFDILNPHRYAEAKRARETGEERDARELASLAITNPRTYVAELERIGKLPETVVERRSAPDAGQGR